MSGENYRFMNNTEANFIECAKNKKVVLFGVADSIRDAIDKIITPNNLKIDYIVDNDFRKWNSKCWGIDVSSPDRLLKEDPDNTVVLITTRYPYRIEEQLLKLNIKNYYSHLLFLEEHIGKYQFMVFF